MHCVKTGIRPEADIAEAHFPSAFHLTGVQTLEDLEKNLPATITSIASFGLSGGLRQILPVTGQAVTATELIGPDQTIYTADKAWRERIFAKTHYYAQRYYSSGLFNTANTPAQRADLYAKYSAWCIDDESLAVAQIAKIRKIPFAIVRVVSDQWDDDVSIASNLLQSSGDVSIPELLKAIAKDRNLDLLKLWRNYNLSIAELGGAAIALGEDFAGAP